MIKIINKYKKFGAYHWKWYGKKLTYTRHVNFLTRWVLEKNTIHITAGDGLIASKLGIRGIDNNPYAYRLAKNRNVKFDLLKTPNLPYQSGTFDSALIVDTLASYINLNQALNETRRIINKYLYIATTIGGKKDNKLGKYHAWQTPQKLTSDVERRGFKLIGEPVFRRDRNHYYFKFEKV